MSIKKEAIFPVYIAQKVIKSIVKTCKKHSKHEVFGYLVGEHYTWKNKHYIILDHFLFLEQAFIGSEFVVQESGEKGVTHDDRNVNETVEFNFNEYQVEFDLLRKKVKNDRLLRLGWWHSHPDFGCFLSTTDVETQRFFFPESYQVALVVDPIKKYYKFFSLDNNSKNGYKPISYAIISLK